MSENEPETYRHNLGLVRKSDRERYLTVLFAPEDKRPALAALYAFNSEVARIRDLVSEPMPGEIRLQWWRDVLSGERDAEGRQHPVGAGLLDAVRDYDLPLVAFANYLEARVFDLYNDPMPTRGDLEGHLGETASILFQLSAQILNGGMDPQCADAAGHAGVAYGISGLVRLAPIHRRRQQIYIPTDMLAAAGVTAEAWLNGEDRQAIARAASTLIALGREHLAMAEAGLKAADRAVKPAFLPISVVKPILARAERRRADILDKPVDLSPIAVQWHFLRRAFRG